MVDSTDTSCSKRVDLDHHALGAKYCWPARIDPAMDSRAQRVESLWHLFEQNPRPDDRFQDLRGAPWSGEARVATYEPTFIMRRLSDLHIEFKPI